MLSSCWRLAVTKIKFMRNSVMWLLWGLRSMHGEGPPRVVLGHSKIASVDIMLNLNQTNTKTKIFNSKYLSKRVCVCVSLMWKNLRDWSQVGCSALHVRNATGLFQVMLRLWHVNLTARGASEEGNASSRLTLLVKLTCSRVTTCSRSDNSFS